MEQRVRDILDRRAIDLAVISTIQTLVQDWDLEEPIDADTRVVADLAFESIDLIQMVAALEEAFVLPNGACVDLLIVNGRYVDDLTIDQIAHGVAARLQTAGEHGRALGR
jgi:acyl carrier protein